MMRFFSYKLTHDTGFAPNPFFGYLTLANCKPGIRKTKKVGDYIAGFTSKELNGDEVGKERLIYIMKIEEMIPHFTYFTDEKFKNKVPRNEQSFAYRAGDNIYKPKIDNYESWSDFETIENFNHHDGQKNEDLSGEKVLVSKEFWYFGKNAILIPQELRPRVPISQHPYGWKTELEVSEKLLDWLKKEFPKYGIYGKPHQWSDSDASWKKDINFIKHLSKD